VGDLVTVALHNISFEWVYDEEQSDQCISASFRPTFFLQMYRRVAAE
jgi:hypothetical protein